MNPHNQQLFIILVHWGATGATKQAISAISAGSQQPHTIVVIDHATAPLQLRRPGVTVIRPSEAAGYAAGINIGLGALVGLGARESDIVVVMNNDVEVYNDSLTQLLAWWRQQREVGLVGVTVEENGRRILGGGYINWLTGRALLRETELLPLHYIHGAWMAAPYEVWLRLHGLSEEYFLYWEDALLGARARQRRYPLHYVPAVRVRHHTNPTVSAEHLYYLVRNGALFMEQETGRPLRWGWRLYNRMRYLYHALSGDKRQRVITRALRDAITRTTGKQTG